MPGAPFSASTKHHTTMPTLPKHRSLSKTASTARLIAALRYFATEGNPPMTTADFVREFTPLLQSDTKTANNFLILKATGFIEVRNPAVLSEWHERTMSTEREAWQS
jgi:hypothetical protein